MISWLGKRKSWLLVLDGLDGTTVRSSVFPENGSMRHTIITARNGNARAFSAQKLEVPILDQEEALQLLSTVSGVSLPPESALRKTGEIIVRELGCLPLAVYHAAMYIRQVGGSPDTYFNELENNRKKLLNWTPVDDKQYSHSVRSVGIKPLPRQGESSSIRPLPWKKSFWKK